MVGKIRYDFEKLENTSYAVFMAREQGDFTWGPIPGEVFSHIKVDHEGDTENKRGPVTGVEECTERRINNGGKGGITSPWRITGSVATVSQCVPNA